jgi:DNA polymerase-3 subunit gamma/tau
MLRNLAVLRAAPEATDLIPVTPETLAELQPLAAAASPGHLQSLFEIFLRVETEVRNATFPRMLLELAVLRAVRLEEVQDIATLLERLEQFERRLAAGGWSAPAPETAPHPAGSDTLAPPDTAQTDELPRRGPITAQAEMPAAPVPAVAPPAGDFFALFLERVQREKGMLAGFLEHGRLLKAADGVLEIGFAPRDSFFLETAREAQNITFLRTVAQELLGGRTEVRLVTIDGDGAGPVAIAHAPRETDAHRKHRHEALNAPALGWAVEILQAQIVEVKIDN